MNSSKHRTFSLNFNFFDHTMHKHKTYSLKKKAFWYWMRILIMFSILLLFLIFLFFIHKLLCYVFLPIKKYITKYIENPPYLMYYII